MDRKHCVHCHKSSPMDAESCIRCGHRFAQTTGQSEAFDTEILLANESSFPSRKPRVSIPPASPHRAGHHPGLHPEDQPYQSSMIKVQRPPKHTPLPSGNTKLFLGSDLVGAPELDEHQSPGSQAHPVGRDQSGTLSGGLVSEAAATIFETPVGQMSPDPITPLPVVPPPSNAMSATRSLGEVGPTPDIRSLPQPAVSPPAWNTEEWQPGAPLDIRPLPQPRMVRKPLVQRRTVPTLLTIACLVLLTVSSVLAYIFLNKNTEIPAAPLLTATPGQLLINGTFTLSGHNFGADDLLSFTRDVNLLVLDNNGRPLVAHTDTAGSFAVHISISTLWGAGEHSIHVTDEAQKLSVSTTITVQPPPTVPPHLQLSQTQIDLGSGMPGTSSHTTITLINRGGGQLLWQTSSDQSWLSVSPGSGTLSTKATVTLTVNRGTLAPQAYSGNVTFTQRGSSDAPLKVSVRMVVEAAPANLTLSASSLSYQASTTRNPPNQVLNLQNSGGQPLDWSVSVGTVDGANWLSTSLTSGHLESNAQVNVSVSVTASTLKAGFYQGTLTFSYGTLSRQVAIALSVNAVPIASIGVQVNTLTFTATTGTNPASKTFSITNTGDATLNWSLTEDQNGTTFAPATPPSGSLAPGKSATITVTPKVTQANPGLINALITLTDSDPGSMVPSQKISMSITINASPPSPISLSTTTMIFANNSILNDTTELLVITNTGSTALDWSLTSSASWLSTDANGGTLNPGESLVIDVTCRSSPLSPGNYQATLKLDSSNSGTPFAPQTVNVSLTVSA